MIFLSSKCIQCTGNIDIFSKNNNEWKTIFNLLLNNLLKNDEEI